MGSDGRFSAEETARYARHLVLKGIGGPGQRKLKGARVLVAGAGALGSPVIAYLAAAGVGTLGIADPDHVSLSNLQRQIIHDTAGVGQTKVTSAAARVAALNPHVAVRPIAEAVTADNAARLMADFDLVIDGTDRFESRAMLAAAAEQAGLPMVAGAVSMFDGQVTVFAPHLSDARGRPGPRFADLYPQVPDLDALPTCEQVGVMGAVTGVIGSLMAMESIKLITGVGTPLIGRLLVYAGREASFSEIAYKRRG